MNIISPITSISSHHFWGVYYESGDGWSDASQLCSRSRVEL